MVERLIAGSLALAAMSCGRVRFEPRDDSSGATTDGATVDSIDPTLVFWLPLDTDANDAITGEAATCLNSCPQRVSGKTGMAIQYANAGECLQFSGAGKNAPTFTLALWVNKPVYGEISYLAKPFDPTLTDFNSWQIEDHVDMSLGLTTHNAGRHDRLFTTDAAPGAWHHIAASFDGALKRIYIDGTLRMAGPEPDPVQYDASPMVIGCDINTGNMVVYPFSGTLDDIRIYSRALADAEIAALAQ